MGNKIAWGNLALLLILASCSQHPTEQIRDDFAVHYDQFHVEGSFVLYDPIEDHYTFYNKSQFSQPFTPASTFKTFNSLIGLETGVIADEHFVIHWDSVTRWRPEWNTDHDLKTAYKNSTVWYYQELARRVGGEKMQFWLNSADYGNRDTTGGINSFWLSRGLQISPEQQIRFLQKLHDGTLPFTKRSVDIVKKIMIDDQTPDYTIRAKTGWGNEQDKDIGWYVGWVEAGGKIYYFANCIQNSHPENPDFVQARKEITITILKSLNIIP